MGDGKKMQECFVDGQLQPRKFDMKWERFSQNHNRETVKKGWIRFKIIETDETVYEKTEMEDYRRLTLNYNYEL